MNIQQRKAGRMRPAALMAFALLAAGCGGTQSFEFHRIDKGDVLTPGVVIKAEDGSFQYAYGQSFDTPWTGTNCPRLPGANNWSLADGARRVTVIHPAAQNPLFGLLVYCPVPPSWGQPSSRSHGIQIPDTYVNAARDGLVSVVYDVVEYQWTYKDPGGNAEDFSEWPAWILWLRDRPF